MTTAVQVEALPHPADTVEEDLRILADSLPQLVWITRPDGYHIYFNARWCDFTGLDRTESFGEGWWSNALHPDDRERTMQVWTRSLRTGEPYEIQYRFRSADGSFRWFLGQALPQRDDSGRIVRWFGTCTDIQAQKKAEEALQASEAWFRTLVEGSADMFATFSPDGVYRWCSPSVEEQLGWRPDDLSGHSIGDVLHPDDAGRVSDLMLELAQKPSRRSRAALRVRNSAGTWRECDVTFRLVLDGSGAPLVIANGRDITDAMQMQQRIDAAERLAALGRVASAMAHEFNNVLMGIQPQADILKRLSDSRVQSAAERIQHSVRRGKSVTEQVLRFTRAEAPRVAPVSVSSVIDTSMTEVSLQLPASISVRIGQEDRSLSMLAEASQIEQTIVNLCLNARDAMPDGGTISVAARRASEATIRSLGLTGPRYVEITVSDTGSGVPPELHERIFEPLFSTKKRSGGSGIGLSIARQMANAHSGALVLDSAVTAGATFRLLLPECMEQTSQPHASDHRPNIPTRVLIVEDDDLVADGMIASLEIIGVSAHRVSSGASALTALRKFAADAVVLDYSLGDVAGTEVYRQLRAQFPQMPVVFVTGHADASVIRNETGCERAVICNKPLALEQLLNAISIAQQRIGCELADTL